MFYPFLNYFNRGRVRTVDNFGIPVLRTNYVTTDTTTTSVTYGICPKLWRQHQYNTYKQRKEAIAKCDEEMAKCQTLLDKLGVDNEPAKENDKIIELQKEVNELKNIIRKANQMVPPPMKEMLPQDMKNAMDKVGQ